MIIWIERTPFIQRVLSSSMLLFAGRTSFGVYSFHWPVICSIGSLCLIKGIQLSWDARIIYFFALFVSIMCTLFLSVLYHLTVEKYSMKIIKNIPL